MSDSFNVTAQEARAAQARTSKQHGGNIPADSEAAGLQHLVDTQNKPKDQLIAERQANLPLPEDPPRASDFNSADARTVNVGSGGTGSDVSYGRGTDAGLREPATGASAVRTDGAANKTHTAGTDVGRSAGGLPSDAVAGSARGHSGLQDTVHGDKGYPHSSDPAGSFDAKVSGRGNPPTA